MRTNALKRRLNSKLNQTKDETQLEVTQRRHSSPNATIFTRPVIRKCESYDEKSHRVLNKKPNLKKFLAAATSLITECFHSFDQSNGKRSGNFIFPFIKEEYSIILSTQQKEKVERLLNLLRRISQQSFFSKSWFSTYFSNHTTETQEIKRNDWANIINRIFLKLKVEETCLPIGFHYFDLIIASVKQLIGFDYKIFIESFEIIFIAVLLLASKTHEDFSIWNFEFLKEFDEIKPLLLIQIEKSVIEILEWNLYISPEEFMFRHKFLVALANIN